MSRRLHEPAGPSARTFRALAAVAAALALVGAGTAGAATATPAPAAAPTAVTAAPAVAAQAMPTSDQPVPAVEPDISAVAADAPTAPEAAALDASAGSVVASAPVTGYATVGVVWDGPTAPAGATVEVRTAGADGVWSDWEPLAVEPGPDGATTGGTEPLVVGDVAQAEAKVEGAEAAGITNVRLAVVDPGTGTVDARAALPADAPVGQSAPASGSSTLASAGSLATAPAITVPGGPTVYSRADWGADESLMTWTPSQGDFKAAVIHHTAGTNDYTAGDVPAILRGIYAYHAVTRDWGDIGYNFLVDKFGRIWEGRSGGVDRETIGGHVLGWNTSTVGVSVLGNYETASPSSASVTAIVKLLGWKLTRLGVKANTNVTLQGRTIPTIVGHRDLGQTSCPGKNLYPKLAEIRTRVAQEQQRILAQQAPPASSSELIYRTHVQDVGWQSWVTEGKVAGTTGRALRVEAIQLQAPGHAGQIACSAHVQDVGWTKSVASPTICGSYGQGKRVEAIKLKPTGSLATTSDLWYRVHVQNIGWTGWARNGATAGSEGLALRVEAVQAVLLPKGSAAPGSTANASASLPAARYRAHVQNIGWQAWRTQGAVAGTTGQALRVEALQLSAPKTPWSGTFQCQAHVQDVGWTSWVGAGSTCGTSGRSLRVEAVRIRPTGTLSAFVDVWYRVHVQNVGWMPWTANGGTAGTTGQSLRVEAIQVQTRAKGSPAP